MAQPVNITKNDGDYRPLQAALYLIGDSPTSRLWKRLRETEGLSYEVSANLEAAEHSRDGTFPITGTYTADQTRRVVSAVQEEMARALDDGFSEVEIAAMKDDLLKSTDMARVEDEDLADRLLSQAFRQRTFLDV